MSADACGPVATPPAFGFQSTEEPRGDGDRAHRRGCQRTEDPSPAPWVKPSSDSELSSGPPPGRRAGRTPKGGRPRATCYRADLGSAPRLTPPRALAAVTAAHKRASQHQRLKEYPTLYANECSALRSTIDHSAARLATLLRAFHVCVRAAALRRPLAVSLRARKRCRQRPARTRPAEALVRVVMIEY